MNSEPEPSPNSSHQIAPGHFWPYNSLSILPDEIMSTFNPISRRLFLTETAKLGMAAMAASTVETLCGADTSGAAPGAAWQLGCYTRVFDQYEYPVALDAIAEAGFKDVGLMTTKGKQGAIIKATTPVEEVRAAHSEAAKRGLKVLSVYGEFPIAESLDANIAGLKRLIDDRPPATART